MRSGNHLVVRAVEGRSLLDVPDSMQPLAPEDELPDVDQTLLALDDPLADARRSKGPMQVESEGARA